MPELGRAFRFVYPILFVAGLNKAYLYDVETGDLVQTIEDTQVLRDGLILGDINYVEISPLHAFICGTLQLRLFERRSGGLVYAIPSRAQHLTKIRIAVDGNASCSSSANKDKATVAVLPCHRLEESGAHPDAEFTAGMIRVPLRRLALTVCN